MTKNLKNTDIEIYTVFMDLKLYNTCLQAAI